MHKANNMNFHLTPLKFLQFLERLKKPYFLATWGPFSPLLGKNEFSQKLGSVRFLTLQLSTSCKNTQKTNERQLKQNYTEITRNISRKNKVTNCSRHQC